MQSLLAYMVVLAGLALLAQPDPAVAAVSPYLALLALALVAARLGGAVPALLAVLGGAALVYPYSQGASTRTLVEWAVFLLLGLGLARFAGAKKGLRQGGSPSGSDEELHRMADLMPDIVHVRNRDGTVSFLNRRGREYAGVDASAFERAIHADDIEQFHRTWQNEGAQDEPYEADFRLPDREGNYRWFHTRCVPLPAQDAPTRRWICLSSDIDDYKQSETARREQEQWLDGALHAARMAAWQWDVAGGTVRHSDNAREILGLTDETTLDNAAAAWASTHPADLPRVRKTVTEAIAARRNYLVQFRWIRPDNGETIWIEAHGSVVLGTDEQPTRVVGVSLDVTRRRSLEQAVRKWQHIFANAGWAVAITEGTSDRLEAVNQAFARMHGCEVEELAGRRLGELFAPESRALLGQHLRAVQSHGDHLYESWHVRKDGTRFPCLAHVSAFRNEDGAILYQAGTFQDIGTLKRIEGELRSHQERLELAQRVGHIGTFEWNIASGEITWSAAEEELYGLRDGAFGGTYEGWLKAVHPDDRARAHSDVQRAVTEGRDLTTEFRIQRPDGGVRWIAAHGTQLRDAAGGTRMIGVNIDVTEHKEIERALRESDRRKDVFLATLAHELRNPLAPLRNGLEIIRLAEGDRRMLDQARAMMERQLQYMVRLVDDLLDISRISHGRIELRRERIALAKVIEAAVESAQPQIESAHHRLVVDLLAVPAWLDADRVRLAQVFANLLNNAAKFTAPGGEIRIEAAVQEDEVEVSVCDSGVGIPPAALTRIFDLFEQLEPTTEQSRSGLGIGLTLVRHLTEMHGGSVRARSDGPGRGSRFSVRLPLAPAPLEAAHIEPHEMRRPVKRRVLIADDNSDAAASLAALLRLMGNDVRIVSNGVDAVEEAREFQPQVLFLDIGMPEMDGLEAAQEIRREEWAKDAVFAALTGWGQEEDKRRALEAGFDRHFTKPIGASDLEDLLAERIESEH